MKILIFMKNWVGDALFQFPAIRMIRQKYPQAEITCIAPSRCHELLRANPDISEILEFDEKSTHRSWLKRLAFIWELSMRGPWDEGYLFHRSRSRALIFFLAGVKKRFGYGKGRGVLLTTAAQEPSEKFHHVDYFLELLHGCGYPVSGNPVYELPVSEEALLQAKPILESLDMPERARFVCFHLGANWEPKRWPIAHFSALAELIHSAWGLSVVVTGGPADESLWEKMRTQVKHTPVFSLIGRTSLDILSAIYSCAAFVVSGDSGPLHIAAAVGTPTVALFGPTNPSLTGPRGKGDSLVLSFVPHGFTAPFFGDEEIAKTWLQHISPQQVFEEIRKKGWVS